MRYLNLKKALLGAAFALIPSLSGAAVTIESSVVGAPSYAPGSNVTVRLEVTGNTGPEIPALAALRLQYDSSTFSFLSAVGQNADGFMGEVNNGAIGSEEVVSGLIVSRDIPTLGNFTNSDPTPEIMDVTFQVKATPVFPTTISADVDPGVSAGLNSFLATTGSPLVPRVFVNTGTTGIGPGGPVTGVVISSSFSGSPVFVSGNTFGAQVQVTTNGSGEIPAAAVLRVTYDSALLAFQSATGGNTDGFLGDIDSGTIGAETPISGTLVYRDIPTLGNFGNTIPTPQVMTVQFEVLPSAQATTSISFDVAPGVSAGLNSFIDVNGNPLTPRTFINSGTSNFVVNPTDPTVELSTSELNFFRQQSGPATGVGTVVIRNTGGAPLSVNSIGISGPNAGLFGLVTNPAPAVLNAGASTTATVRFFPPAGLGNFSASLDVSSSDPSNPAVSVSLAGVTYSGDNSVNTATYTGPGGLFTSSSDYFFDEADQIGSLLGAGNRRFVELINNAVANSGRGQLDVKFTAGTLPNLAGDDLLVLESGSAGVPEPFGVAVRKVGEAGYTVFRYTHAQSYDSTINSFFTAVDFSDFGLANGDEVQDVRIISLHNDSATTAPNLEDRVDSATGEGVLNLDAGSGTGFQILQGGLSALPANTFATSQLDADITYVVGLHALNSLPGDIDVSEGRAFAREIGGSTTAVSNVVIRNIGGTTLTISSVTLSGPGASQFALTTAAPAAIGPGQSYNQGITYSSLLVAGTSDAQLTVNSNDPDSPSVVRTLTGYSFDPDDSVTTGVYVSPYGSVPSNGSTNFDVDQNDHAASIFLGTPGRRLPLLTSGGDGDTSRGVVQYQFGTTGVLVNRPGADLLVFEAGSANQPEPFTVAVRKAGEAAYSAPRYKFASGYEGGTRQQFVTAFDLSEFGLAAGDAIDSIEITSIKNANANPFLPTYGEDRVLDASGQGEVVFDAGPSVGFEIKQGPLSASPLSPYSNALLDTDLTYVVGLSSLQENVYVALRGDDATGDGSFANPYRTIQKGVTEVAVGGEVRVIEGGVFDELTLINKTLSLLATDANTTVTWTGADARALITVQAQNVTVDGFIFEVNQPNVDHGIWARRSEGNFNGLTVTDNVFAAVGVNGADIASGVTLTGGGGSPIMNANLSRNRVTFLGDPILSTIDRGFDLVEVAANVGVDGGNTFELSRRQDVRISGNRSATTIINNTFSGAAVDLSAPGADVFLTNNTFDAIIDGAFPQAVVIKSSRQAGATVNITGNTIEGYLVGVFSGASNNVAVSGNTFNGSGNSFTAHLIYDTGYDTASRPGSVTYQNAISVTGNTFNQSAVVGSAIQINNQWADLYSSQPEPFNTASSIFSSNVFNFSNGDFFTLSDAGAFPTTSTFNAESNTYLVATGLKTPAAMTSNADQNNLNGRTFDRLDNGTLGLVIYNLPTVVQNEVYVSLAGDDVTGDGSFANPYRTIQKGITEVTAGGQIFVIGGGVFDEANVINKALRLSAVDSNTTVTWSGASTLAILDVRSNNVRIEGFNFEIRQSSASFGVYASDAVGPFNNLWVDSNTFAGVSNNLGISAAVHLLGSGGPVEYVRLTSNSVNLIGNPAQTTLDRGFFLESIGGDVGLPGAGNTFAGSRRQDVLVRFSNAGTTITDNLFRGVGVDLSEPNRTVRVVNNSFDANIAGVYAQAVVVKARQTAGNSVTVDGNTFNNYPVGVYVGGSNNTTVSNNTFNGSADAFQAHVIFDSGYTVSSPPPFGYLKTTQMALLNNTFNQSPVPGTGVQIDNNFWYLYNGGMPFDTTNTVFQGNVFNYASGDFFRLSEVTDFETTTSFNAANNTYLLASGLKAPAAMVTVQDQNEINARTFDRLDNPILGQIIYNLPGTPVLNEAYVSLAGDDITGDGTFSNPFRTIRKGVTEVQANGQVFVIDGGTFDEFTSITKPLTLTAVDPGTILTWTGAVTPAILEVRANNVRIEGFNFEILQSSTIYGIFATDTGGSVFNNLRVDNNTFAGVGNNVAISAAVHLLGTGGVSEYVRLTNNTVNVVGDPAQTTLDRGFFLERLTSDVGLPGQGNVFNGSRRQDVLLRFSSGGTTITENLFRGVGVDLSEPNRHVNVTNNTFSANIAGTYAQAVVVKAHQNVSSLVTVDGNTFTDYPVGVYVGGSDKVTVSNNTFNGSASAFQAHVILDSGYTVSSPPPFGYLKRTQLALLNNTFNQSPVPGTGVQIDNNFWYLYNGGMPFDTTNTVFQGNAFNYASGDFFRLSEVTDFETTTSFNAENNTYLLASGLKAPAVITTVQDRNEINARTFDRLDNPILGEIIYNFPGPPVLNEAYVSLTGDDTTGDGTFSNPFRTIQKGLAEVQANGQVFVIDGGIFDEANTISKALTLTAVDPNTTVTWSGASTLAILDVRANNVTIEGFNFEIRQSSASFGVYASDAVGPFNNLRVDSNTFAGVSNNLGISAAVHLLGSGGPVEYVRLTNNSINLIGNPAQTTLDRGFFLESIGGDVGLPGQGNTFAGSRRQDVLVRFSNAGTTITDNLFRGVGVDLSEPNRTVRVENNTFDANIAGVYAQAVVVKARQTAGNSVTVDGNTFTGYPVGVYVGGSNNTTVSNNTFNGSADAFQAHVIFDSGYTVSSPPPFGYLKSTQLALLNNTFNQSPVPGTGVQIDNNFWYLYNGGMPFDTTNTVFQGNAFNYASGDFFRLSEVTDFETTTSFNAENNTYLLASGLKAPAAMVTVQDQNEINARTFDRLDNPILGQIIYNLPGAPILNEAYVSLVGDDTTGDGTFSNPFRTIQKGVTEVQPNGQVFVIDGGEFDELTSITKALTLTAVDPNTTVTWTGAPALALVEVRASNVTVNGFNFAINQPQVQYGIAGRDSLGSFDNLVVTNNTFAGSGTNGSDISGGVLAENIGGPVETVTLQGNRVIAVGDPLNSTLDRGFWLERVTATVGGAGASEGNTFELSRRQDILIRFSSTNSSIVGNTFRGSGIDVSGYAGNLSIESNSFDAFIPGVFPQGIVVKSFTSAGSAVTIDSNTFTGYTVGVNSGGSRNVSVVNNTFNGSANSFTAHVVFDSGYDTGAVPPFIGIQNQLRLENNTFNESPVAGVGVRIDNSFASSYTAQPFDGAGSVIQGNIFNFANGEFFRLSDAADAETTESFNAENNTYLLASGLKAPASMTSFADQAELNSRTFDRLDNATLGLVIYNLPAIILNETYVSLSGSDITGDGSVINPFRTIQKGVTEVTAGGQVFVIDGGVFDELTTITKALTLTAVDPNTTVTFTGGVSNALVTVRSNNVTIEGFKFEISQQNTLNGVFARDTEGPFNNLNVRNNDFVGVGTNVAISAAVNLLGTGSPVEYVRLTGNRVLTQGDLLQTTLDRGFVLESISGDVGLPGSGNSFALSRRQDVLVRFSNAGTTITANTFSGAGVDLSEPNRSVNVTDNTFTAALEGVFAQAIAVKARRSGGGDFVNVAGNTITGYTVGVLTGGSNNVTVENNTFNGSANSFTAHVLFDSGYPVSSPPAGPLPQVSLSLLNNTFNQSAVPGTAVQIDNSFANLYTGQPFNEAATVFSGNVFNFASGNFYQLSDATDFETTASFNGENNTYLVPSGLQLPAAMTNVSDQADLNGRTFDQLDNGLLGLVVYNLPATINNADVALTGSLNLVSPFSTLDNPTFSYRLDNFGPDAADGTTVTLSFPGFSGVNVAVTGENGGATSSFTTSGNDVEVTALTLPSGGSIEFEVVGVAPGTPGIYTATGSASVISVDGNLANNSANIPYEIQVQTDLDVIKTVSSTTATVGTTLVYTLTVNNSGPNDATGVIVSDPLPANSVLVGSITSSQGTAPTVIAGSVVANLGDIAAGGSATVTYSLLPTQFGSLDNTAFVTGNETDPDPSDNSSNVSVAVLSPSDTGNVDLAVLTSSFPIPGTTGKALNIVSSVVNLGVDTETAAVFSQAIPASFTVVNVSTDKGSVSVDTNNVVTVNVGAMGAGETVNISVLVVPGAAGLYSSDVLVGGLINDFDLTNNDDQAIIDVVDPVESSDLVISKSAADTQVDLGGRTTWTVSVTNNGPDTATNVSIYDSLPFGFTYENAVITAGTGSVSVLGGRLTGYFPSVANGETATIDIVGTFPVAGTITNEVLVSSSQADPDGGETASASVLVVVPPTPEADLVVSKSVDQSTVTQDSQVVFTVTVTNNGPSTATNVLLLDTVPSEFDLVSVFADIGSVSTAGNAVSLSVPTHPAGVTATLTITATARTPVVLVTNSASASSGVNDPNPSNNTATADVEILEPLVNMSVLKTANLGAILLGDEVTFTIETTNNGPTTATDVLVTDTLPAGLEFVSATADIGLISVSGQTVNLIVPAHPVGVTATLTVIARGTGTGVQSNTATVDSASSETDSSDNTSTADVTVSQATADLSVVTNVTNSAPALASPITYTATFTNNGPQPALNTVAVVTVPSGYLVQSVNASTGFLVSSGGTYTITIPVFNAGSNLVVTIVVVPQVTAASNITASVSSTTLDPNAGNNSGTQTVTANGAVIPFSGNNFTSPLPTAQIALLGQQIPNVIGTFHDAAAGAYAAAVLPGSTLYNSTGFVSEGASNLPYSAVGPDRIVRGKFSVYQRPLTSTPNTPDAARIPAVRMRIANRFAVSSMLEVNSHTAGDPAIAAFAAEVTPSANPAAPSVYRVDLDPVDVPYLISNPSEGIRYGFEALKNAADDQGILYLTDISLGTYSIYATTNSVAAIQTYAPSGGSAGNLGLGGDGFLDRFTFQLNAQGQAINVNNPGSPAPQYSEGGFGVTLSTANVPANTIGVITREFNGGAFNTRARVQDARQYQVRVNLSSIQSTLNQAQVRVRARTLKFAYTQYLVLGGAWAVGTDPLVGNAAIANQSLPGIGTQNPDRRNGQTNGGWYNLIVHSPINASIRPDVAGSINARMPNITSQPGPGVNSESFRDLRVGLDLIDSISPGQNAANELGVVTLDEIQIREYNQVAD